MERDGPRFVASYAGRRLGRGDWDSDPGFLLASSRGGYFNPTLEYNDIGFRVASVPEPGSITLMLCGALAGLYLWRRRK